MKGKKPDSKPSLYGPKAVVFPLRHVATRRQCQKQWINWPSIISLLCFYALLDIKNYNSTFHYISNLALVLSRVCTYWVPKSGCFQVPFLGHKSPNDCLCFIQVQLYWKRVKNLLIGTHILTCLFRRFAPFSSSKEISAFFHSMFSHFSEKASYHHKFLMYSLEK